MNPTQVLSDALDILFTFNHPEWPNLTNADGQGYLHLETAWVLRRIYGELQSWRFGESEYDYVLACILARTIELGYAYTWDLPTEKQY